MKARMFSHLVKPKSPTITIQTFKDLAGCSTRCASLDKEFGEIVVSHDVINSEIELYEELKKQDSLLKQSVLLIAFQNMLPKNASPLIQIVDFGKVRDGHMKHRTVYDMAFGVIKTHCSHMLQRPSRKHT